MYQIRKSFLIFFIFSLSIISILSAFYIEYVLKYPPCSLCLIQRIPYYLSLVICSVFFFSRKYDKIILQLILINFIISFLLSFYHFGIEMSLFEESSLCSTTKQNFDSPVDLLKSLDIVQISCKSVTFKILGFSLATINLLLNSVIIIITFISLKKYEKN